MKIGVGIISFNRPHLLRQTLDSIKNQSDLQDLELYFFQDGAVNKFSGKRYANDNQIANSYGIADNSDLFGPRMFDDGVNLGTAIQKYNAHQFLANKYQAFIMLEDDVILDIHCLHVLKVLLHQYRDDTTVGPVVSSIATYCKQPYEEIKNAVFKWKKGLWWAGGYGLWATKWAVIRQYYEEYYTLVKNRDYRQRPHRTIYKLFEKKDCFPYKTSAQDAGLLYALNMAKRCGVYTAVPRSKHIGDTGLHCTPKIQKDHGWDKVKLPAFESDKTITHFKEVPPCKK